MEGPACALSLIPCCLECLTSVSLLAMRGHLVGEAGCGASNRASRISLQEGVACELWQKSCPP